VVLRNARPADAVLLIIQACILVVLITVLERRGRKANGTLTSKQQSIEDETRGAI
jgi:hypothetical protein